MYTAPQCLIAARRRRRRRHLCTCPLKYNLRRALGHRNVIPIKSSIRAMLLLLDCHRKFLKCLVIKPALSQHPRKFPRQCPLVIVTCEEGNGFATSPTPTYIWLPRLMTQASRRLTPSVLTCTTDAMDIVFNR